jgi:Na+-translocating ferredoxin:NAD+ oxidoreductase RnfG subunit
VMGICTLIPDHPSHTILCRHTADTISGATLTSKAYLQAVENALIQAQHE